MTCWSPAHAQHKCQMKHADQLPPTARNTNPLQCITRPHLLLFPSFCVFNRHETPRLRTTNIMRLELVYYDSQPFNFANEILGPRDTLLGASSPAVEHGQRSGRKRRKGFLLKLLEFAPLPGSPAAHAHHSSVFSWSAGIKIALAGALRADSQQSRVDEDYACACVCTYMCIKQGPHGLSWRAPMPSVSLFALASIGCAIPVWDDATLAWDL